MSGYSQIVATYLLTWGSEEFNFCILEQKLTMLWFVHFVECFNWKPLGNALVSTQYKVSTQYRFLCKCLSMIM